jgi:hypothetical protein
MGGVLCIINEMAKPLRKNLPEVNQTAQTKKVRAVVRVSKSTANENDSIGAKSAIKTKKSATIKLRSVANLESREINKKNTTPTVVAASKKKVPKVKMALEDVVSETVFVPSTASLRLLEKLELYKAWYDSVLPNKVSYFAKASGYTFLLLGTIFASYTQIISQGYSNAGALVCSDDTNCVEVENEDLANTAPLVTFLNTVPDVLQNDVDVVIRRERAAAVSVYLEGVESGRKFELNSLDSANQTEAKYLIVLQSLEAGSYILKAKAEVSGVTYIFSGSQFKVIGKTVTHSENKIKDTPNNEDFATSTLENNLITEAGLAPTSTIEREVESDEEVISRPLSVMIESIADSVFLRVGTGSFAPSEVLIYSQPKFSDHPLFLGQATLVQGDWIYSLSAIDLPSYEHELYAEFEVQGHTYNTATVSYTPIPPITPALSLSSELKLVVEKVDLALSTAELDVKNRSQYYSYIASTTNNFFESNNEGSYASDGEISVANATLDEITSDINRSLERYGAAVQTGQKYLLTVASLSQRLLYQNYLRNNNINNPTIETLLSQRFQSLRDRVKEEEERISAETNELTMRDTDSDGVSDFDEISTFNIDPNRTDTDRDGILDGVEVVTGSNPVQADVSALPKVNNSLSELIQPDILQIKAIEVVNSVEQGKNDTYLLLRGKTVPHATIWFDFPTLGQMGFIKANSEGVFAYTLEQIISDGEHTVTAVLPDAFGNSAAITSPISYKIQNNRLVASAMASEALSSVREISVRNMAPVTTAGVALVAFGFLLLILSALARPKHKTGLRGSV